MGQAVKTNVAEREPEPHRFAEARAGAPSASVPNTNFNSFFLFTVYLRIKNNFNKQKIRRRDRPQSLC
jgi:hypothetical protein